MRAIIRAANFGWGKAATNIPHPDRVRTLSLRTSPTSPQGEVMRHVTQPFMGSVRRDHAPWGVSVILHLIVVAGLAFRARALTLS